MAFHGSTSRASQQRTQTSVHASPYVPVHKKSSSVSSNKPVATPPATASSHARTKSTASGRPSTDREGDDAWRHPIGNVGKEGPPYLRQNNRPTHSVNILPATPPDTSGGQDYLTPAWPKIWQGDGSGGYATKGRASVYDRTKGTTVPVPPLSLANHARRRRARSFSISSASDKAKDAAPDALSSTHGSQAAGEMERSASAQDVREDLLTLQIPHYRLGSPRWSAQGTAYLHHHSMYTNSSDDRSSVQTQQPYDQLFPVPPGVRKDSSARHSYAAHLHPSSAAYALSPLRATSSIASSQDGTPATLFDKLELNPNDPSTVRFAPGSAQIVAATIPRLIVQITSVRFLDYELLSDFFLSYRGFLSPTDLLDWLLERMRWAINSLSDTGRIVRVRTFVALRHWVLNYFADDFISSFDLRRRFCDSINRLALDLAHKPRGSGDLNIVGELKKCWRRTAAQNWPVPDALNASAVADIFPGVGPEDEIVVEDSTTSLPQIFHHDWARNSNQALGKGSQLFVLDRKTNQKAKIVSIVSDGSAVYVHRGSIPASPLSEDSLKILSCSIPFLQKIRPGANAEAYARKHAARPALPRRQNSLSRRSPAETLHRRDGSFNDALRDPRAPLPSSSTEPVSLEQLPNIALTGGLVRGLLLTPPPAAITRYAVRSPPMEPGRHGRNASEDYFDDTDMQQTGVKRIVQRALSLRKSSSEASHHTHQSGGSNGSRGSNRLRDDQPPRSEPPQAAGPEYPSTTTRIDKLAVRLQASYRQHFLGGDADDSHHDADQIAVALPKAENARPTLPRSRSHRRSISDVARRLGSQISTSPRSIVIINATSLPSPVATHTGNVAPGLAPDTIEPSPLFEGLSDYPAPQHAKNLASNSSDLHTNEAFLGRHQQDRDSSIDGRLRQSFLFPAPLQLNSGEIYTGQNRKSSDVHGTLPPLLNQLRRRPGGDLKAADRVHDLVLPPTPDDELSTSPPKPPSRNFSVLSAPTLDKTRRAMQINPDSQGLLSFDPMDRDPSHPQVYPPLHPNAQLLNDMAQSSTAGGGVDDTLATLEGKLRTSQTSGLSWFELPAEYQGLQPVHSRELETSSMDKANLQVLGLAEWPDPSMETVHTSVLDSSNNGRYTGIAVSPTYPPRDFGTNKPQDSKSFASSGKSHDADSHSRPRTRKSDMLSTALTVQSSFLLDDNESLSDLSTALTDGTDGQSLGVRSFYLDEAAEKEGRSGDLRPAGRAQQYREEYHRSTEAVSQDANLDSRSIKVSTAASKILGVPAGAVVTDRGQVNPRNIQPPRDEDKQTHLPFVLAFEAEVIAEQLCIIEKDGMDEVDWKDLIALNWQHSPKQIRNWAEYLKQEDPNGIDLVIARFNLTVKWVVSECVLTEAINERALCISKFIHIAVHCLRLRNYASMYQITLALLSSDLAHLKRTWSFVPLGDRRMLDRLEILCQPLRNFHNLRLEMESASLAEGCIPFIGLYTHDLTYNAQKPARLEAVRTGATDEDGLTLINFERFQTAAVITKGLLRLLEASARYVFRPHPEALSRCLWLAALEDSEISAISSALE